MRPFKSFKRASLYYAVRAIWGLFNIVPRRWAIAAGGAIGALAWNLIKRDQRIVVDNLSLVYGDSMSLKEKRDIGRGFFVNSGKNLADIVRFQKKFQSEMFPVISCEGLEHFDTAYRRGKGIIAITGHIGNFELLAAYMASRGYKTAVIGRELHDERLNALLIGNRTAMGIVNVVTTDPTIRLVRLLRDGYALGVLIDTDSHRVRNATIPFFGHPANTPIGQSILALRTGAAVLPVFCLRMPENRYQVVFYPEIPPHDLEGRDTPEIELTARCTRGLENIIDAHRDQWIWLHRRWTHNLNYPS